MPGASGSRSQMWRSSAIGSQDFGAGLLPNTTTAVLARNPIPILGGDRATLTLCSRPVQQLPQDPATPDPAPENEP